MNHKKRTCVWAGTQLAHTTPRVRYPRARPGGTVRGQTGDTAPATPTGAREAPDRRRVTVGTVLEFQVFAVTQSPETSSAVKRVYKAVFDIETLT